MSKRRNLHFDDYDGDGVVVIEEMEDDFVVIESGVSILNKL